MDEVFTSKLVVARKDYLCDASDRWNCMGSDLSECTTSAQREAVKASQTDGGRILRGQTYLKVTGKSDGELCTYRARPGMDKVCRELDLWID